MQIALFGATGGTGRQVTQQALAAGYSVAALVRDPAKMPATHPNLHIIPGNVLNAEPVAGALRGAGAAIICLGNTSANPDRVVSRGTGLIVDAMQNQGVRRLVVVSAIGVGDSRDQVPFFFKLLTKTLLRQTMQDKEAQEAIVRGSDLDWTIVRPGGLIDGPATGHYTVGSGSSLRAGRIARADLAAFLVAQIHDTAYLRQTCAITGTKR
ncbi:MAG: SDR family oxidoreductase [Caldilineaceae bacterium]|nr:SDR family oxidoreductase [Caldilineaceae bacterium]